jgi:hypothetical protein
MKYWALRCPCGATEFRVSGRPQVTSGSGSYFWRTLTRVWREARQATRDGEPVDSPFSLPLALECAACGRKEEIFSTAQWEAVRPRVIESQPREAYRCRACRRAVVELVIGIVGFDAPIDEPSDHAKPMASDGAVEVVARCQACKREARIAWSDRRPSHQEVQLDVLYGRR